MTQALWYIFYVKLKTGIVVIFFLILKVCSEVKIKQVMKLNV